MRRLFIILSIVIIVGIICVSTLFLRSRSKAKDIPFTKITLGDPIKTGSVTFIISSVTPLRSGFSLQMAGEKEARQLKSFVIKGVLKNIGTEDTYIKQAAIIGISEKAVSKSVQPLGTPIAELMKELDIAPGKEYLFETEVQTLRSDRIFFYWQITLSNGRVVPSGLYSVSTTAAYNK